VKITAMFGKLLQPEAIFDSSCIKSYGDQARSESLQRSPTDRHRAGFKAKRHFAAGKDRGGRTGTGQKGGDDGSFPLPQTRGSATFPTDENPDPLYTEKGEDNGEPTHPRKVAK